MKMQLMVKKRFRGKMRKLFFTITGAVAILVFLLLISLARLIFAPSTIVDYSSQFFVPLMYCIFLPLVAVFVRKQHYLECDEQGVLYSTINYRMYSPWSNIGTIAPVDSMIFKGKRTEALMLKEKAIPGSIEEGQAHGRAVIERRTGRYNIRPKRQTEFSIWVIPTEFVADEAESFAFFIHTYAPHLLLGQTQK